MTENLASDQRPIRTTEVKMSSSNEENVLVRAPPSQGGNIFDDIIEDDLIRERKPLPPDKIYHVFFSYGDEDKLWVKEAVRKLEKEHGYICCDHERDFLAGSEIMNNIKIGITKSAKVVVVLSEEAVESGYIRQEIKIAHKFGLDSNKNLLIPILRKDCDMPDEMMLLTYIDAREGIDERTWWSKLLAAIESTEQGLTPLLTQLCWIENRVSCKKRSIEPISKDCERVPVSIATSAREEILYHPRIKWRQKYRNRVCGLLIAGIFIVAAVLFPVINEHAWKYCPDCAIIGAEIVVVVIIAIFCFMGRHYFLKMPASVEKKIVEQNTILIHTGVMLTLSSKYYWGEATIVFYQCNIEQCKAFVIRQLKKHARLERLQRLNRPANDQNRNGKDTVQLSIESRSEEINEDTMELKVFSNDEGEDEDEPLLGSAAMGKTLEDMAFRMLMKCTPEYLRKAFASKLINYKEEDRHARNYICFCQYLENSFRI